MCTQSVPVSQNKETVQNKETPQKTIQLAIGEVSHFLEHALQQFEPEAAPQTRGRPRILPSLCLWGAMLFCLFRGGDSQLALWRMIRHYGVFSYPPLDISDQAVYKRLETEGETPLQKLFLHVSALLEERLRLFEDRPDGYRLGGKLAPFASEVVALDEMTLDQVRRTLPSLRGMPDGDDARIPGKIAALFDVRRQQFRHIEFLEDFHQNCKQVARTVLADLPPQALLLCDLGYFAFEFFDWLTDHQLFYISRLRAKTSFTRLHVFYEKGQTLDALVYLGAYRSDKAAHAVRLVQFRQGEALRTYLTNVTDPQHLTLVDIAHLYARRWNIESAFRLLKQYLHLHLLWSAKGVVVRQQLWCALILAQVIHALHWEIALRAGVDLFEVSLPLLLRYLPQYFARHASGEAAITQFVADGPSAGFIRASRRLQVAAPQIAFECYKAAPPDLVTQRPSRHSHCKCGKNRNEQNRNEQK